MAARREQFIQEYLLNGGKGQKFKYRSIFDDGLVLLCFATK